MSIAHVIGRDRKLFCEDLRRNAENVDAAIRNRRVLIYGGAGSIGREVVRQCFQRAPAALHVIDISENNLVELVRDLRSSLGYISGDTQFLPIAMNGPESRAFLESEAPYDVVLNLAAMKHVRSEKDAFSLMRMIVTNVLDTRDTLQIAAAQRASKYFAVSTDKAKNPANLMGATKRIMEDFLFGADSLTPVSTARFANVAFSDGSLLHGFAQRVARQQPISAPRDVKRYFVTGEEAGMLCLAATALGGHGEIFFPKLNAEVDLLTFSEIARRFLAQAGYEVAELESEQEARDRANELIARRRWPCYFFESDTSGEKPFEEFYGAGDQISWDRFEDIGVISQPALGDAERRRAQDFAVAVERLRTDGRWRREDLIRLIVDACPELAHIDTGAFLDNRM